MGRLTAAVFAEAAAGGGIMGAGLAAFAGSAGAAAAGTLRVGTGLAGGRAIFGTIISQRAAEPAACAPSTVPTTSSATALRERGAGRMGASVKEGAAGRGLRATTDADSRAGPLM